jgi:hypothetical protein
VQLNEAPSCTAFCVSCSVVPGLFEGDGVGFVDACCELLPDPAVPVPLPAVAVPPPVAACCPSGPAQAEIMTARKTPVTSLIFVIICMKINPRV